MKVSEVMTRDVQTIQPDQTAQQAASFMLSADAAAKAAARIIADRHDDATDAKLVDQAIKDLAP